MPSTKVERSFYPNGQLRSEVTLLNGFPNGFTRFWYENGVLSEELSVKNGTPEGISRRWNDKGELIGTFEIRNGTGIQKLWHDNGVLIGELSHVNGKLTGRQRCWFEDGRLATDVFWIRGRQVSRKRYFEACKTDSSLPRYDSEPKVETLEDEMKRLAQPKKKRVPNPRALQAAQRRLQEFLSDSTKCEARKWLKGTGKGKTRTLGEIPDRAESLALIEEAYDAGVAEVLVVDVESDDRMENAGTLVVRLSKTIRKRKKALAWCNEQFEHQGFGPESDEGQEWVVVRLD